MTAHYKSSTIRASSPKDNCGNFLIDGFDKNGNDRNDMEDKGYVDGEMDAVELIYVIYDDLINMIQ